MRFYQKAMMVLAATIGIGYAADKAQMPKLEGLTNISMVYVYDQDKKGEPDALSLYPVCPVSDSSGKLHFITFPEHPYAIIDRKTGQAYYDYNVDGYIDGQSGLNSRILKYLKFPDCKELIKKLEDEIQKDDKDKPEDNQDNDIAPQQVMK